MTSETWKQVREWFYQASELEGAGLAQFLDSLPDAQMRHEVETLLAAAQSGDSLLDTPALVGMSQALTELSAEVNAAEEPSALASGQSIEQYEILRLLGQGGSGTVYQARHIEDSRIVALKLLKTTRTSSVPGLVADREADPFALWQANSHPDADQRKRFLREARMLTALRHPNIVSVLGIFESEGRSVIAMEFVDGSPLGEHITPGKGMPIDVALRVASGIAQALSVAHAAGITHRDLKPGNVLVTRNDGQAKLVDFGAAKQTPNALGETVSGLTTTGSGLLIGSPAYMSPEQAEGDPVDSRSDIFSFGSLLYEMVSGIRVFERKTMFASMSAVIREHPEPVTSVAPQVPERLAAIIHRCLRKDARLRFADGAAVWKALQKL